MMSRQPHEANGSRGIQVPEARPLAQPSNWYAADAAHADQRGRLRLADPIHGPRRARGLSLQAQLAASRSATGIQRKSW